MELVLICLCNCSQSMKMTQELNSVMRLNVVHPVAEHLKKCVQDPPGVRLENSRQKLTLRNKVIYDTN